ncbi:4-hydroxythreonine-4-phosphate dehydrogenase PdxA [Paenibacillus sp. FSL R10-2734]|uniref:4-hydroxythreonine-4-phosphate dehydrogenase PdxA n=1 Tax=Paenibacillus sp. FSL R10-2734 TaxID=2954691 RepID=UPI0030DBDB31
MNKSKPVIGITMGDAAGVGPEIIVKALAHSKIYDWCQPVVIGEKKVLERAMPLVKSELALEVLNESSDWTEAGQAGTISLVDVSYPMAPPEFGQLSAEAGDAAYRCVKKAVELGLAGKIGAICTAPLNKEALHLGGHLYPGHTELLAHLMDVKDYAMMLAAPKLRVIHATTHVGLKDAIDRLSPQRILRVIQLADDLLRKSGITSPRIAVCGINPHAGENGLFGNGEEGEKIVPAIQEAVAAGINATGPYPADTVFFRAVRGDFDCVVAMYHDQGHIPIKVLGMEEGVNISVGMPLVRTSVDHGTAFDIAGTGIADESSLIEAIRQAAALVPHS